MRPKVSNETLKKQFSLQLTKQIRIRQKHFQKILYDNNLIEKSLRHNRSEPLFQTIREFPGIGKRPRTRDDIRLKRNLPLSFIFVRQKPRQTFIFRILLALNLDFPFQT